MQTSRRLQVERDLLLLLPPLLPGVDGVGDPEAAVSGRDGSRTLHVKSLLELETGNVLEYGNYIEPEKRPSTYVCRTNDCSIS